MSKVADQSKKAFCALKVDLCVAPIPLSGIRAVSAWRGPRGSELDGAAIQGEKTSNQELQRLPVGQFGDDVTPQRTLLHPSEQNEALRLCHSVRNLFPDHPWDKKIVTYIGVTNRVNNYSSPMDGICRSPWNNRGCVHGP